MNDIKSQKLKAVLGKTGSLRDMIDENKFWRALAGDNTRPVNEVKKAYLKAQGLNGTLNDMEKQYWKNK